MQKDNLLFIHYPSGGYGFYLTRLMNRYLNGVVKVNDKFEFDALGTSHLLPLVYGHLHFNEHKNFDLSSSDPIYHDSIHQGNYVLIPCCPGINDDMMSDTMKDYPNSKFVRLWYDDRTWPLVFFNAIVKAMKGDINRDVHFDEKQFGSSEEWARRENFSLLLDSHCLRQEWKPNTHDRVHNVNIFSLLIDPASCLSDIANFLEVSTTTPQDLGEKHQDFLQCNPATVLHLKILDTVEHLNREQTLDWVEDLYWQGVINFYVEQKYDVLIPYNTYSNWFTDTAEIVTMAKNQGIKI
jgi:hypothetical protein